MPPRTTSCSAGSVTSRPSSPAISAARAEVLELVAGGSVTCRAPSGGGRCWRPSSASKLRVLEQRAAELALDQRAHHQRADDQDHLVHGSPERIGLRADRAPPRRAPVAARRLEQAMEEVGARLGTLGERAAEVVAQRGLAAQQRADDLCALLDDLAAAIRRSGTSPQRGLMRRTTASSTAWQAPPWSRSGGRRGRGDAGVARDCPQRCGGDAVRGEPLDRRLADARLGGGSGQVALTRLSR